MKGLKKYLTTEIGIEFKAALYFFAMLFFYSIYRITQGSWEANIIVMTEMMTANYIMGYVQVFLLRNFEETEKIGKYEVIAIFGCSIVYCIVSWLGNWFDHSVGVTIGFTAYVIIAYYCMIFVYYAKRHIDTELLNDDLEAFKKREGHSNEK